MSAAQMQKDGAAAMALNENVTVDRASVMMPTADVQVQ